MIKDLMHIGGAILSWILAYVILITQKSFFLTALAVLIGGIGVLILCPVISDVRRPTRTQPESELEKKFRELTALSHGKMEFHGDGDVKRKEDDFNVT